MAKYYLTYKCGHEGCVELFGKEEKRKHILDSALENECPECARKKKIKDSDIELTGTEKQVAWALDIRREMIKNLELNIQKVEKYIERMESRGKDATKYIEELDKYKIKLEKAKTETTARWFINNRYI